MPGCAQSTRRRRMGSRAISDAGLGLDVHRALLGGEATEVGADREGDRVRLGVLAGALVVLDEPTHALVRVDRVGLVGVGALVGGGRGGEVGLFAGELAVGWLAGDGDLFLRVTRDALAVVAGVRSREALFFERVGCFRDAAAQRWLLRCSTVSARRLGSRGWASTGPSPAAAPPRA